MTESPDWLPEESAYAGRENLDPGHVARYDEKEDADGPGEVERLRAAGLDSSSLVVELGPGTGQFTLAAAPVAERVIAVDPSPPMLARLREKVAAHRLDNVDLVDAGFLTYQHERGLADLVYSRYALHHLPDTWKAVALARMRSMLRTGRVLRLWDVVYDFDPADAPERFERWCAAGGQSVQGEWSRAEFAEHLRTEHSTFTWLLEPMIERSGFRIETTEFLFDGFGARYLARAV